MTPRRSPWLNLITLLFLLLFAGNALAQFCAPPSPPPPPPVLPDDTYCGGPPGGGGSGGGGGGGGNGGGGGGGAASTTPGGQTAPGAAGGGGAGGSSGGPSPSPSCPSNNCTGSPCSVASGNYTSQATDLSIVTAGFPLMVTRKYESARPIDSILGIGWTVNLAARLHYATYLYAAPNVVQKEAHVVLPSGLRLKFVEDSATGLFTPPPARYDVLVKNPDGSFDLELADGSTLYHFGASGRLETIADEFGNALTFTHDTNDRVIRVDDNAGSGRHLDVTYGANGRIATVADPTGRTIEYSYDTNGSLTSVEDAAGREFTYDYTFVRYAPLLTRITDPWGRVVSAATYDSRGRTATYTEEGETYTYTYNYSNRTDQSSKVDSSGNRWVYTYSPTGVITERSYPGAASGSVIYNSDGTIQDLTDPVGVRTHFTYGTAARIASVTRDYNGSSAVRFDYSYDANFPTKITSVLPKSPSTNAYDGNWQGFRNQYHQAGSTAPGALWKQYRVRTNGVTEDLVATYTYNSQGKPTSKTDASGGVTDYTYDVGGNLITETAPAHDATGTRAVTTYAYDALGRLTSTTDPLGNATTYTWDAVDRLATATRPKPSAGSPLNFVMTYTYDVTDATYPGVIFARVTDVNGKISSIGRDPFGRLVRRTDALGNVTTYTYDKAVLRSTTDANGNATTYAYDALDRLTGVTFSDSTSETYRYRGDGLMDRKTDRKNQIVNYTYDAMKRLKQRSYPNGTSVTLTFAGQNLASVTDSTVTPSETHAFTYDDRYRTISVQEASRGTVDYTYTSGDRVATYSVFGGPTTSYTYFDNGTVRSVEWSPVTGEFEFAYRADGRRQLVSFPNGQSRSYTYDDQGRLLSVANTHPTVGDLGTFQYGYDYDASGNAIHRGLRTSLTSGGATTRYAYDDVSALTSVTYPGGGVHAWSYDSIGNRTTTTVGGVTTSSTFQKIGTNPKNWIRLTNDGSRALTHDANGNVTAAGTLGLTWDYENHLTALTGSTTAAYAYDYQNRRSTKTTGTTTTYVYDGLHLVREMAAQTTDYLMGPSIDEPLALIRGGNVSYYVADGLGSVSALNDASGTVQNTYAYDVWGVATTATESVPQPYRYTGREVGDTGNLQYSRYRQYDAANGRFLSEDPLTMLGTRARADGLLREPPFFPEYMYARNSPAMYTDPLGLDPGGNGGPTGCVQGCIDNLTTDTYKCLKTLTITQLGCIAGFTACVGFSGGLATPACVVGLAACEAWAFTNWFSCKSDVAMNYKKCLKGCC